MTQVYFVATPIGNLGEITFRAVQVLNSVDVIYCEDTRCSRVLLDKYNLNKPLRAFHKFNEKAVSQSIIEQVKNGSNIAVVSDAGMPAISDPGNNLVNELIEAGISYTVVSGACALVNAMVLSGFSPPFTFMGFLPDQKVDCQKLLDQVNVNNTLIFYCSVYDIADNIKYLYQVLGDRRACIAREISKLHESVVFGTLDNITPDVCKGEFVLLIDKQQHKSSLCDLPVCQHVEAYIASGLSKNEAIKKAAKDRGVSKNVIYSEFFADKTSLLTKATKK